MGYRNPIATRPHVDPRTFLMELIGNGRTWHFDARLYRYTDTERLMAHAFYVQIQTRAGGRDHLQTNTYKLHLGAHSPLQFVGKLDGERLFATEITLQDRTLTPEQRVALNTVHWSHIRPMAERRPDAFTASSLAFWYIRAPSIDPMEGLTNYSAS